MGDGGPREAWPASALWDYAVTLYAAPGVAECCLSLQDRRGADVNLILFACWLGAIGRDPGPERLVEVLRRAESWQEGLVRPLREARRRLKVELPMLAEPLRAPLTAARAGLAAAELALERGELLLIETSAAIPTAGVTGYGSAHAVRMLRHLVALESDDEPDLQTLVAAAFPGGAGHDAVSAASVTGG